VTQRRTDLVVPPLGAATPDPAEGPLGVVVMGGGPAGLTAAYYGLAGGEDRDRCDRLLSAGVRLAYQPQAVVRHFHTLSAGSFWKQHFRYGQGAFHFRKARALSALLGVSQAANAAGFFREAWRRRLDGSALRGHLGERANEVSDPNKARARVRKRMFGPGA